MKNHMIRYIIIAEIAALCAAAVIIGILVYRQNHLTAKDLGITALMNEKIVSARYVYNDDCIHFHEAECGEEEVMSFLEILKNAEFRPVKEDNPNKDRIGYLSKKVIGETESGKTFTFGIYGVVFEFSFDGKGRYKYYECSEEAEDNYRDKFRELKGRPINLEPGGSHTTYQ